MHATILKIEDEKNFQEYDRIVWNGATNILAKNVYLLSIFSRVAILAIGRILLAPQASELYSVKYRSDYSPEHVAIVAVDNKCGIRQGKKNKQINNMIWKTYILEKKNWASNLIKVKRKHNQLKAWFWIFLSYCLLLLFTVSRDTGAFVFFLIFDYACVTVRGFEYHNFLLSQWKLWYSKPRTVTQA